MALCGLAIAAAILYLAYQIAGIWGLIIAIGLGGLWMLFNDD